MKKGEDYTGVTIVYACHDGEGNFLFAKRGKNARDEHGNWDIGAGGLEFTDTITNTLAKEVMEEYCTDVLSHEFLGYRDVHREKNGKQTHWVALDFIAHVDRNKVQIGEPHKFDELGWFKLDSLPDPLHSQLPYFLEDYKEKLI